ENSDADAEGDAGECALAAGSERERDTNQGHDEGNKGIGKLPIELDGEADYVKAALAQIADIMPQFESTHLFRGSHLLLKIGGLLRHLVEGGHRKGQVFVNPVSRKVAHPSVFQHPP